MSRRISECGEDLCPVCSEVVTIFSIGKCGHMICFRCSTRMRVLCEQLYCAICRSDLPEVVLLGRHGKITEYDYKRFRCNMKAKVYFENETYESAFYQLLEHSCKRCPELKPFRHFGLLKDHNRKEHGLQYCDLCVKHIKLFSQERKVYTRQQLAQHRRVGDADDKSHKGHPLCQFCDERYLDNDELLRHLRKDHYFCHFCDADGITNQFYGDYNFLKDHFRDSHFLCEEGECAFAEFTNAFRSKIDYQGHLASSHSKGMRRQQQRQARTLDIDFNYTSSRHTQRRDRERGVLTGGDYEENRRANRGGRGNRQQRAREREELETAQAISASLKEVQRSGHVNVVDQELVRPQLEAPAPKETVSYEKATEDFPTLDGKTMSDSDSSSEDNEKAGHQTTLAKKFAVAHKFSVAHGSMGEEDFPTLGGNAPVRQVTGNSRVWGSSSGAQDSRGSSRGKGGGGGERGSYRPPPPQPQTVYAPPPPSLFQQLGSSDFPSLSSISSGLLTSNTKDVKRPAAIPQSSHSTKVAKQNHNTGSASKQNHNTGSASKQNHNAGSASKQNHNTGSASKQNQNTGSASKSSSSSGPSQKPANTIPGANFPPAEKSKTEKSSKKSNESATPKNKSSEKLESAGKSESKSQKSNANKMQKDSKDSKPQKERKPRKEENVAPSKTVKPEPVAPKKDSIRSQSDNSSASKPAQTKSYQEFSESFQDYPSLSKPAKKSESALEKTSVPSSKDDYPALSKAKDKQANMTDYPSFGKSSIKDDYPSLSKANNKYANVTDQYPSLGKSSSCDDYPALSKTNGKSANVTEDYPSLGKSSSYDNYPALSKSNGKPAALADQYPALGKPSPRDDYPALSKSNGKPAKVAEQYPVLNKSSKALQDDFPVLGKAAKTQAPVQWGPKGSQKNQASESSEQFVTVKGKPNRRRKKNPKGNSKGSSLQGTDEEASDNEVNELMEKFSSSTRNFEVLENLKEKENKKESKKSEQSEKQESKSSKKNAKKEKQERAEVVSNVDKDSGDFKDNFQNGPISNGKSEEPLDDFPSLSLLKDQSNLPSFNALGLSDFPALGGSATSQSVPKPPPGFSSSSSSNPPPAPPPGFAKPAPPPGFSMPSIHFESQQPEPASPPPSIAQSPPLQPSIIQHVYSQPNDATLRNQSLLMAIQEHTSKSDFFSQFKSASGEFRRGQLSALDYYNKCASLIGLDNFLQVFPELLALLPDIPKQQELLAAHNTHRRRLAESSGKKNRNKWNARDDTFQTCAACGQVLIRPDYYSHVDAHSLDDEFPSLS